MIGLKARVTENVSLTIIPKERRRVAITLLPAIPSGGGGGGSIYPFETAASSGLVVVILEDI